MVNHDKGLCISLALVLAMLTKAHREAYQCIVGSLLWYQSITATGGDSNQRML